MTTDTTNGAPSLQESYAQVTALHERYLTRAREAAMLCIDSYERAVCHGIAFEVDAAGLTGHEWFRSLAEAQGKVVRDGAAAYARATRALLN